MNTFILLKTPMITWMMVTDIDDDHDLVVDIDSDTLIRIVKSLKRDKAPGHDNIHD